MVTLIARGETAKLFVERVMVNLSIVVFSFDLKLKKRIFDTSKLKMNAIFNCTYIWSAI